METPLPERWRRQVCEILASSDKGKIFVRQRALREWEALFPFAFVSDLYQALASALEDEHLKGNAVTTMEEPGEVYEFIFLYQNRKVYCKVNLDSVGKLIIIYSAHRPLK